MEIIFNFQSMAAEEINKMEQNKIYFVAVIHNFMQFIFVNLFLNAISGTKLDALLFSLYSLVTSAFPLQRFQVLMPWTVIAN